MHQSHLPHRTRCPAVISSTITRMSRKGTLTPPLSLGERGEEGNANELWRTPQG
jgi:hypothetical protein